MKHTVLQGVAGFCRVLQGVAGCCSVLQCVAVCCSVLQCMSGVMLYKVAKTHRNLISVGHSAKQPYN